MKIDFHVHSVSYSACAEATLEEQVRSAINKGVDAFFITEHMRLHNQKKIDQINFKHAPFKVYQGIEITIQGDTYEDILVLGIHDSKIEKRNWTYEGLYKFVKSKGGLLILAHPYRFSDRVDKGVWDYPPDGVEVLSSNIGEYNYQRRLALAERLSAAIFTNSDSHHIETTGCYVNDFPEWCVNEHYIFKAIKAREFQCATM